MASSNITLSAGVRQNLLSLQSTAQLMSMTQNRLATGKKVNSALDNPVNFFTSSSLHARANDLSTLLDSMSNGIKTLEAADNALTSITNTVQSMQSTLRQARQDKSFKTNSYTVALGATPAGTEQLAITGGSVGATAVNIALTSSSTTAATNALVTGTSALSSIDTTGTADSNAVLTGATALGSIDTTVATNAVAAGTSALAPVDASLGDITFEVNGELVTLDDAFAGSGGTGIYSADEVRDAINTQVGVSAGVAASLDTSGNLVITSTGTAGALDEVTVDTFSAGDATQLGFASAAVTENGTDGADITFDVNGETVTLAQSGGTAGVWSAAQIRDAINTQVGTSAGVAATLSTGGNLVLTSTGTAGASDTVTVDNFSSGDVSQLGYAAGASATDSGADGTAAADLTFDVNGQTVTLAQSGGTAGVWSATQIRDAINTQVGTSANVAATLDTSGNLVITSTGTAGLADTVTVDNFSAGDATQLGFAGATATDAGTDEVAGTTFTAKTVDQLVIDINSNTSLTGKIVASNDNGKLRIQNLSTADLTVTGLTNGAISGGIGSNTIGGNDVRKTLVSQFNTLLDQLNKTADDASYNGINLLRSDKLKLTLNETGTSTLEIQALDKNNVATSIDAAYLGITGAVNADFDSDATLDSRLDTLAVSLTTLRAQASSFGSNLSIVQNRQDFTKAMITTLQTGGDNLILADTNEEGANLLALQTRQQLSTTALSLSAQADQAVLRLF